MSLNFNTKPLFFARDLRSPIHSMAQRSLQNMQNEGDFITLDVFNNLDGKNESVEELFLNDTSAGVLAGLIESKPKAQLISPEDLAWVDSCLVADSESSLETSWVSLKEALLDSIATLVDSYEENNAAGFDEDQEDDNGEQMDVDKEVAFEKQDIENELSDATHIRQSANHTEGEAYPDANDVEEEIHKAIESRESVFKVWNLREEQEDDDEEDDLIPELKKAVEGLEGEEKEDHFITQLKQAVAESILRDKERVPTEDDGKLDELVSSMIDLTLNPSFN